MTKKTYLKMLQRESELKYEVNKTKTIMDGLFIDYVQAWTDITGDLMGNIDEAKVGLACGRCNQQCGDIHFNYKGKKVKEGDVPLKIQIDGEYYGVCGQCVKEYKKKYPEVKTKRGNKITDDNYGIFSKRTNQSI